MSTGVPPRRDTPPKAPEGLGPPFSPRSLTDPKYAPVLGRVPPSDFPAVSFLSAHAYGELIRERLLTFEDEDAHIQSLVREFHAGLCGYPPPLVPRAAYSACEELGLELAAVCFRDLATRAPPASGPGSPVSPSAATSSSAAPPEVSEGFEVDKR